MSYNTMAAIANDWQLRLRIAACAAQQSKGPTSGPVAWTDKYLWQISATPGWDTVWAAALAAGSATPGHDESVITDQMILSAVQALPAS